MSDSVDKIVAQLRVDLMQAVVTAGANFGMKGIFFEEGAEAIRRELLTALKAHELTVQALSEKTGRIH